MTTGRLYDYGEYSDRSSSEFLHLAEVAGHDGQDAGGDQEAGQQGDQAHKEPNGLQRKL